MTVISASDFIEWKSNPVTKAFFEACDIRIEDAKDQLAISAGIDATQDNLLRGIIYAYREMQDFRIDDIEGMEVENGN
jgi:hypothetical protein